MVDGNWITLTQKWISWSDVLIWAGEITGCTSACLPKIILAQIMASNITAIPINQQSEKADYRMGENTCNPISDKELISRINKNLRLNNNNKITQLKNGQRT